ncbi:hypothetical protein TNCT_633721 [Trichonephila clavata]|uniref:Uncharacterized protein n=1 Tax=Trichonephila clavata TaxID=2740835 RepID=A0A8X6KMR1_TRICU|nr:hypothetical protein TNCT_633721 [Trichonephila clavata]
MDSLHSPVQPYQAHYQVNLPDTKECGRIVRTPPSDIQHWLDALKPEGKINLVTESYLSCCLCCIYVSSMKSFQ